MMVMMKGITRLRFTNGPPLLPRPGISQSTPLMTTCITILPHEERVDLDRDAMSVRFTVMTSVTTGKKSKLLSERVGVTRLNLGLDAMMLDALQPYKQLVERLQTQNGPIYSASYVRMDSRNVRSSQ